MAAAASIEVAGLPAYEVAQELRAALAANAEPGDSVSAVEVHRSADLAVAVVGLVFGGVGAAKTISDWWRSRRPNEPVKVTIIMDDGVSFDMSDVGRERLEVEFKRRAAPPSDV